MAIPLSFLDRANETTATTGTGTVTLSGTAVATYQTWANAGAANLGQYPYLITDGLNEEWGVGTFTTSGTTFSRDTVTGSIISGTSGTSKINLSGGASIAQVERAADVAAEVLIKETVASASASNVTFSSIIGIYRHLRVRVTGRGDLAGNSFVTLAMQLNGDTGANYDYTEVHTPNTSWSGNTGTAATSAIIGNLPAATAPANVPGYSELIIPNYIGTTFHKDFTGLDGVKISNSAGNNFIGSFYGVWRNTAAVTSIKIFPTSGNFVDNSIVSLYGIR